MVSKQALLLLRMHVRTDVANLGDGKVLADADTRAAIEWHVLPGSRRPVLPAVRTVNVRVGECLRRGRIEVAAALHCVGAVDDVVSLEACNVGLARCAGECGILN